jgi:hypothetical protein
MAGGCCGQTPAISGRDPYAEPDHSGDDPADGT